MARQEGNTLFRSIVIVLLGIVAGSLVWRWLSRRFSLPCPTWLAGILEWEPGSLADTMMGTQATLDRIGFKPGQRVLEIGPGPGRLLIPASQRVLPGGEVVGLDIQPGMLERLTARAARAGVKNLTTVLGDASQANFPPASFDVIYLCTVLGEIPGRAAALRQCFAALKPGGELSITEIFPDPHYQAREAVQHLAEAAGFRLKVIEGAWYFFTANFIKP